MLFAVTYTPTSGLSEERDKLEKTTPILEKAFAWRDSIR